MSQIKVGATVVFIPSKFFPNDEMAVGVIAARVKSDSKFICYQIVWDGKKHYTNIPEYMLNTSPQYKMFSNKKKALAFILTHV